MKTNQALYVVLPVLNEENALTRLVPDLVTVLRSLTSRFFIVIVDDGSTDGTAALSEHFPSDFSVTLIRHPRNAGYGASLASGFRWAAARALDQDVLICMDSDNTHQPVYVSALARKLNEGFDVVTASYQMPGGQAYGVPWARRLLSYLVNRVLAHAYPLPAMTTYTNGFRAYRTTFLKKVISDPSVPTETGFAGGTELFLRVCAQGARPAEIPFDLHYEERGRDSKINVPRTIQGYLRLIRESYRLRSVLPA